MSVQYAIVLYTDTVLHGRSIQAIKKYNTIIVLYSLIAETPLQCIILSASTVHHRVYTRTVYEVGIVYNTCIHTVRV